MNKWQKGSTVLVVILVIVVALIVGGLIWYYSAGQNPVANPGYQSSPLVPASNTIATTPASSSVTACDAQILSDYNFTTPADPAVAQPIVVSSSSYNSFALAEKKYNVDYNSAWGTAISGNQIYFVAYLDSSEQNEGIFRSTTTDFLDQSAQPILIANLGSLGYDDLLKELWLINGNTLVTFTDNDTFYAYDAQSGKLLWSNTNLLANEPVLASDGIYIVTNGTLKKIDLSTGKPDWMFNGVSGYPFLSSGTVYVAENSGTEIYGVNATSGQAVYHFNTNLKNTLSNEVADWESCGGSIYIKEAVSQNNFEVDRFDPQTGSVKDIGTTNFPEKG
jgi:outer membrane protein assembly factor BamB